MAAEIPVSGKPRLPGSPLGNEEPCARMSSTQPSTAAGDVSALGESALPRADSKPRRLTFAVLLDYLNFFGGGYEAQLRDVYVDGLKAGENASITLRPADLGNTPNNFIGRSQVAADPYLNGSIDEFRVYDRALSPGEIQALYTDRMGG